MLRPVLLMNRVMSATKKRAMQVTHVYVCDRASGDVSVITCVIVIMSAMERVLIYVSCCRSGEDQNQL